MDSGCWYCGKPTLEIWHTTFDVDDQKWPMCAGCSIAVRSRLALREQGLGYEADLGDERHGIDTRGISGKWIDPKIKTHQLKNLQAPRAIKKETGDLFSELEND